MLLTNGYVFDTCVGMESQLSVAEAIRTRLKNTNEKLERVCLFAIHACMHDAWDANGNAHGCIGSYRATERIGYEPTRAASS